MQAEKQQAWKISVQAKAKNFHFKLKATQIAPSTWKLHRLSISLKLRKLFLGVNAESTGHQKTKKNSQFTSLLVPGQQQKETLKSKFLIFVKKFRFRSTKKPQRFSYEELISAGNLVNGGLAFLPQSIIRVLVILLLLMVAAAFASPAVLDFNNYLKYCGKIRGAWSKLLT
ncbi:hypothetical protein PRUPE_6G293200 [Prunus persica]|uniref:Uncharacterized protein n=1 Tax=Prunus persica TaxID=3760 RepID=A0A251NXB1_PRUPE|nr:uncharacterized protein LOC18772903 [Prunus persica]ONI03941.1 hypothetical protein PRUPE_6G293200 [Prunus persica]